jgi:hypothetical protein
MSVKKLLIIFLIGIHSGLLNAEIIFSETFDNQLDYVSDHTEALTYEFDAESIPAGWYASRQSSEWDPSTGDINNHHSIEILSSNSDKARGNDGKSMVVHRESIDKGKGAWVAEGLMLKYFPQGHDDLYVSFWLNFDDDWTKKSGWTSKLFRIYAWNPEDSPITKFFSDGGSGPIALWDYQVSNFGLRNRWSLRGGPYGEHYQMVSDIEGFPRSLNGNGDASLNFTHDTVGQGDLGVTPEIPDLVNGGFISDDLDQTVSHDQVYGSSGSWTKLSFYVKMNSAPGVTDGVLKQWVNDILILDNSNIPWVGSKPWSESTTGQAMPKWNVVGFGGNSYFNPFDQSDKHEEWYSIDDILIRDRLPIRPKPPTNFRIIDQ